MFLPNESLQKFSQSVPFCSQTEPLEAVRSIFISGNCDLVVVVNHKLAPQGSIYLHSLLPYMVSHNEINARLSPQTPSGLNLQRENSEKKRLKTKSPRATKTKSFDWHKPLKFLKPPILSGLKVLPARLSPAELMSYLHDGPNDREAIALVDEKGKFVGLLDHLSLLAFLAQKQNSENEYSSKTRQVFSREEKSVTLEDNPLFPREQVSTGGYQTVAMASPEASPSLIACPLNNEWPEETTLQKCNDFTNIVEILEQLPVPLMVQNKEGLVISQNKAWRSQLGRDKELTEIVAKAVTLSQTEQQQQEVAIAPNNTARAFSKITIPIGDRLPCSSGPHCPDSPPSNQELSSFSERARGDGYVCFCSIKAAQERVWQFAYQPLFDLSLVMAQDLTEKHLVAQELEAKNADLIKLNRLKDEFLACITHELKTPLTAVLGLSKLLAGEALGKLNDRQGRYANLIHQSGRHLMTVVNDILDLTRIETGQMELTPQPVKIKEVCDRAYKETLELRTKGNAIPSNPNPSGSAENAQQTKFSIKIEPGLEMLVADELRLRQMLVNLLSNALKFTELGGKIKLKVSRWERWIAFTVSDTGIGIPAEKQHLIFQKFQQLESPLTRQFEGTGLGLVLTQRLARLHGGDVTFISKENKGSEFTLILPPSPPPHASISVRQTKESFSKKRAIEQTAINKPPSKLPITNNQKLNPNYSSRLILIVEAVPQYIEDLTEKMTGLGYQVVIARSGAEALEKVRQLQPRAIFLNPVLTVLSGWDVLTLLKTDPDTSEIPVIITATRGDKERASLQKADGFLSLPVQQLNLEKTLAESLQTVSYIPHQKLTILRIIYGKNSQASALEAKHPSMYDLSLLLHPYDCRIVEASEIEEAELLAQIWHPNVLLLENIGNDLNSQESIEKISKEPTLKSMPLVTLDARTTEAANEVKGLSVFPCLDYEKGSNSKEKTENDSEFIASALWQVISIAARTNFPSNILVVDVSTIVDFTASSSKSLSEEAAIISQGRQEKSTAENIESSGNLDSTQALIQYLKIAGFTGLLTRYWAEVLQHLQYQSTDLLLICLRGNLPSKLLEGLLNLKELNPTTPIIVWEDADFTLPENLTSAKLNSILGEIANKVLPSSTSMPDLLGQIKQAIYQSKVKEFVTNN
ncbi:MAG: hybrid sensor histidine kinase/response regulator [Cyanobacteriota bacterium]|nr:hybrid sensor histidine kinase/response regulator [Cyanobacteriota bacterium]